ncbi:hypothetical protein [uncultured Shewanella sp.]|uniref:hypothetical protein n=1 Tax=uncultured Shewanella sp. TaxID=173975 RepID=UPI00262CAF5C|nr:hypothetical protein [uncultured Shewanella sp.]
MKAILLLLPLLLFPKLTCALSVIKEQEIVSSSGSSSHSPNLVLVTIDGLRWNEMIDGANLRLINSPHWVLDINQVKHDFWTEGKEKRREKIMPFLWQKMVTQGVLIGTGHDYIADIEPKEGDCNLFPAIDACLAMSSTDTQQDSDIIQWLKSAFPFGSLSMPFGVRLTPVFFKHIVNQKSSYWKENRFDSKAYYYAAQSLRAHYQKVTYVSFGATDMYLHEGNYGQYLYAARRIDGYIARLWALLQSLPQYKDNTIMVVVNSHHLKRVSRTATEKTVKGYYPLWFVAMGPNIRAVGELNEHFPISPADISHLLLILLNKSPELAPPRLNTLLKHFLEPAKVIE